MSARLISAFTDLQVQVVTVEMASFPVRHRHLLSLYDGLQLLG
jgi:hypothetical protein